MKEFAPKTRKRTSKGATVWEVDCRPWGQLLERLGHPLRCRFETKAQAEAWVRRLVVDAAVGRQLDLGPVAVRALCDLYLKSVANSEKAKGTHDTYRSWLRRFLRFLESRKVVDAQDVNAPLMDMYRMDCSVALSRAGQTSAMLVVQAMFRWAVSMGYVEFNPVEGLVPRMPKGGRRAFTAPEREKLLEDAAPKLRPVWTLLFLTGLRRRELTGLSLEDAVVDSPAPFLRVVGKGGRTRTVPLSAIALEIVKDFVQDAAAAGRDTLIPYNYQGLYRRWAKERERIGLPAELDLHSFRHTFATELVNHTGTPLTEAARVLGHSSTKTTEIYVHEDQAILRQGIQRLNGRMVQKRYQGQEPVTGIAQTQGSSGD